MTNNPLDLKKITYVLENYTDSTGLSGKVIDIAGNELMKIGTHDSVYKIYDLDVDQLKKSLLYGANQSFTFGGSYIFFGPFGLVYFTTPIVIEEVISGAYVIGPILMTPPDPFFFTGILKHAGNGADREANIVTIVENIPVIAPSKVKSLANLLMISVHFVSPDPYKKFVEDQSQMAHRSEMAMYMQYLKTMGGETLSGAAYPIKKEKELMNLITLGDQSGANKVLNEILAYIYIGYGMNFKKMKSRVLELVVLLSRAALEGGAQAEEIFGLNYSYLNDIHEFNTVDQLTEWLAKISIRFTESVFHFGEAKHQDSVYKALDYIKHNYMNKLTLEEVAGNVFFSSTYFSRIFKSETGTSFNKYLNKVRVNASKQLLRDKDLSLSDIAIAIGYHDQSHFSKVFKTSEGISPKRYRESIK